MSAPSIQCGAAALDGTDDIWGSNDEVAPREWSKMDEEFTNAGYREGITAGKESALQEGFDDGYDNIGSPLGREIGTLRGVASAAMSLFSSTGTRGMARPEDPERWRGELNDIIRDLARITLADLAPRDIQAEEHAREHLESDASGEIQLTMGQDVNYHLKIWDSAPSAPSPAVEELRRLRARISDVLKEFGLVVALE